MIRRIAIIAAWIAVVAVGAGLRFDRLSVRPMHFDEATGARITGNRMDPSVGYAFNPAHNHGPLLSFLSAPLNHLCGEHSWKELTKGTLRLLPALAGTLLVLVPLAWRRRWGDGPMLLAAAFLATSPLLVYYSRMFIHEILLALFGMLALLALFRKPKYGLLGVLLGLMFATKETFVISVLAWGGAAVVLAVENRRLLTRVRLHSWWTAYRTPATATLLAAGITALGFYTDVFRSPEGALDAVRTFFVYETVAGHDKPWSYYPELLLVPRKAGVWWFETPVFVLALLAFLLSFGRGKEAVRARPVIRFLAYAAVLHVVIYSCFAYKTPWLMCLPWAHVCLLAGFALVRAPAWRLPWKIAVGVLLVSALALQVRQARRAAGRFENDPRNPYAYVPTSGDIESVERWLGQLREDWPGEPLDTVAVVGSFYWPLPWYLRGFDEVGYLPEPDERIDGLPIVFALPEEAAAVEERLEKTHTGNLRSLRPEVPVMLYIRNDVWDHWMEQ